MDAGQSVIVALFGLIVLGSGVVTLAKGRYAAFILGLVTIGTIWVVAALWPARDDSWWAQRRRRR